MSTKQQTKKGKSIQEIKETFTEPCDMYYTIFTPKGSTLDEAYEYRQLSPFEFKNILIKHAEARAKVLKIPQMYNAERGNPNFFAVIPRYAFSLLNYLCTIIGDEYSDFPDSCGIGMIPPKKGIGEKFEKMLKHCTGKDGRFLQDAVKEMKKLSKLPKDEFYHQLTISTIGCFYPDPPRIQPFVQPVLTEFLNTAVFPNKSLRNKVDIFPTEGVTAAIVYIFNSLKYNGIVTPEDEVGILTPIFSPYLEIPRLRNYKLKPICVKAREQMNWEIPHNELEQLRNPKMKAIFMVNPTNPSSTSLTRETVKDIKDIITKDNPNLIVITDNVYAPFVDNFNCLMDVIPRNVISVYSFSKYFGTTGWRIGCIIMHKNNVIDDKLLNVHNKKGKEYTPPQELQKDITRYQMIQVDPWKIKFIDRLLIDSREVAEAHTAGLSTPQQVLMCLFGMYDYLDIERIYNEELKTLLLQRSDSLLEPLEYKITETDRNSNYYVVIDLIKASNNLCGGTDFGDYLVNHRDPLEFILRLAKKYATVVLPAVGFAGPFWGIRVSLANLDGEYYPIIGDNIRQLIEDYYKEYKKFVREQKNQS